MGHLRAVALLSVCILFAYFRGGELSLLVDNPHFARSLVVVPVTIVALWRFPRVRTALIVLALGALVFHMDTEVSDTCPSPATLSPQGIVLPGRHPELAEQARGRVILITGANSGAGLAIATHMYSLGATVVMGCRGPRSRCRDAAATVAAHGRGTGTTSPGSVLVPDAPLDLASLELVTAFAAAVADTVGPVDILVNNAGFNQARGRTADGLEPMMGAMHIGHAHLTQLVLGARPPGHHTRVVNVGSGMHHRCSTAECFDDGLFARIADAGAGPAAEEDGLGYAR